MTAECGGWGLELGRGYEHPRGGATTAIESGKALTGGGAGGSQEGARPCRGGAPSPLLSSRGHRPPARPTGYGEGFDDVVIQGDLEELKFVAFYTK